MADSSNSNLPELAVEPAANDLFYLTIASLLGSGTLANKKIKYSTLKSYLTAITESNITLADVTTDDVSITKHGFAPKAPNDATKYLDGTGAYSVPAGGGGGATNDFKWSERIAPASPAAQDDEFSDSSITGWTTFDPGSVLTSTEDANGLTLSVVTSTPKLCGLYKALPAGDFTIQWAFRLTAQAMGASKWIYGGLGLWEDATNTTKKIYSLGHYNNGGVPSMGADLWTNYTTWSATKLTGAVGNTYGQVRIFRLRRNGTTMYHEFSYDGTLFFPVATTTYSWTQDFTPTHFGVCGVNYSTTATQKFLFDYIRYTGSDVGAVGYGLGRRAKVGA
jgi:hypothetical protein